MLSAAHVLAMDTKNLLDVCDSIRARFPHVTYELSEAPVNSQAPANQHQQTAQLPQQHQAGSPNQQEFYENVSKVERLELTEQIYCNENPPSDIGIYDNQSAIQEQLRIVEDPPPSSPTSAAAAGVESQFSQKILSN